MDDVLPFERPLGATPSGIRVWAPKAERVAVRVGGDEHQLEPEGLGVWSGAPPWRAGDDYWVLLDGRRLPDPCTRLQPKGLRGPSRVVEPPQVSRAVTSRGRSGLAWYRRAASSRAAGVR